MKRVLAIVLMSLFIIMAFGCATTSNKVKIMPVKDNPGIYNRIVEIGRKVIVVVDPENLKNYKIAIADDQGVNAFTTMPQTDDTGKSIYLIVFLSGTLSIFDDEELTFIMAHEVAHCKLNHVQKKAGLSLGISAIFTVAGVFVPGAGLLDYAVNPLATSAYSRSQETDADILAVKTLKKLDMSSDPAIRSFKILDNIAVQKGIMDNERIGILDDHPSLQARIQKIRELR